jgi:hypothetical protein
MPLRGTNNPYPPATILAAIRNIIHLNVLGQPCTYLASIDPGDPSASPPIAAGTGLSLTYIHNKFEMALRMRAAVPYALHLEVGRSRYTKGGGPRVYTGTMEAIFTYCARWDDQASSIDAIWKTMDDDLERLKSNLESNDSVQYGNAAFVVSVPSIAVGPYRGSENSNYPGLTLVERQMSAIVNILPFDCLT